MSTVECPLCSASMHLTVYENLKAYNEEKETYSWDCEECPGKLLEYHDDNDLKAIIHHKAIPGKIEEGVGNE